MHVLLQLGWFSGWVLGIAGFFIARSARSDVRQLRQALARQTNNNNLQPATSEPIPAVPQAADGESLSPQPAVPAKPPRDYEALLTTRLGVWVGSIALLFAGIFLVRYAVEQALLGPAARCAAAAALGLTLLGGAEWLHRHEGPPIVGPFRIDQAPGAFAAGGIAILFGAAYGSGPLYGLLPALAAFVAMAAASLAGLAAALRYGPLTAATGIAGAFITPALVTTQTPPLPGLFSYLFIVSAAALVVLRRTAWIWLGWTTTLAGCIWVCYTAIRSEPDDWAAAAFVPAAAALNLALLPAASFNHPVGRRLAWIPFAALGIAGLVLEAFAPGPAPRLGLFLLSPIGVWKGFMEPRLDRLPWIAALFGLLALLFWNLQAWTLVNPPVQADSIFQAIGPGSPAPQPFITAACLFAGFNAVAGMWLERRAPHKRHWAALVAAVPVLTLAVAYAQMTRFHTGVAWAAAALALSAALTATATAAGRENDRQRAGVHAAGAVAALALGCGMVLHDYWLTLAVALFLPPLAWMEAQTQLPPLRQVAMAVAALVMVRLLLNWYVLDYAFGTIPLFNGFFAAYAVPGMAFALASVMFRRRADDRLVAMLEAGAVAFLAVFIALEIRHWYGGGQLTQNFSFTEAALHLLTIGIQATAYLYLANRSGRLVLGRAGQILGGIALIYAVALLVLNPMVTDAPAGITTLATAYLAPAVLAVLACRQLPATTLRQGVGAYAVVAGFAWITLQIRQVFHPGQLSLYDTAIEDAELWAWSGAWLVYGAGLMIQGIRSAHRTMRLAGLGVIGLVCAKVFLIDMSGLAGLWRVLSFLGLGLALIGVGVVYRRFVLQTKLEQPSPSE